MCLYGKPICRIIVQLFVAINDLLYFEMRIICSFNLVCHSSIDYMSEHKCNNDNNNNK